MMRRGANVGLGLLLLSVGCAERVAERDRAELVDDGGATAGEDGSVDSAPGAEPEAGVPGDLAACSEGRVYTGSASFGDFPFNFGIQPPPPGDLEAVAGATTIDGDLWVSDGAALEKLGCVRRVTGDVRLGRQSRSEVGPGDG